MSDKTKGTIKELVKDVIIAVVIVAGVSIFIRPTLVKETSMEPSIEPNDYLIMSKQAYKFSDLKRGDVIVFRSDLKLENGHKKLLIKRVVGLPGDVITITGGNVWLNGSKVSEHRGKYITYRCLKVRCSLWAITGLSASTAENWGV